MKKKARSFWTEFKNFIMRGNVIDLSVGIIVGGAFTTIVKSLTNDVLMPFIGAILGGVDFKGLRVGLWNSTVVTSEDGAVLFDEYGQPVLSSAIYYGRFIQAIIDFLIIALVIFMLIKVINAIHRKLEEVKKKEEAAAEEVRKAEAAEAEVAKKAQPAPEDILLLREIRDLLREEKPTTKSSE